jgi:hypothetical protein
MLSPFCVYRPGITSPLAKAGEVTLIFWAPRAGASSFASFGVSAAPTPNAQSAAKADPKIMLRVTDFIVPTL